MKDKLINFGLSFLFFVLFVIGLSTIWTFIVSSGLISIFYNNPLFIDTNKLLENGSMIIFILGIIVLLFFKKIFLYYRNENGKIKISKFFQFFFGFVLLFIFTFSIFGEGIKKGVIKYNAKKITGEEISDRKIDAIINPNSFLDFCENKNSEVIEDKSTIIYSKYCIIDGKKCYEHTYKENFCEN